MNNENIAEKSTDVVQFHVAPMQCYTNLPMRQLFHNLCPEATLWSEMEKVQDLLDADPAALERRFGSPGGIRNVVLQLGGNDPNKVGECIQRLHDSGYVFPELNLNCGCPSIESGGAANFGASLMRQPELTKDLITAMKESTPDDTTISLKCRVAVYDTPDDMTSDNDGAYSEKQYENLVNYIDHARQGGTSN